MIRATIPCFNNVTILDSFPQSTSVLVIFPFFQHNVNAGLVAAECDRGITYISHSSHTHAWLMLSRISVYMHVTMVTVACEEAMFTFANSSPLS